MLEGTVSYDFKILSLDTSYGDYEDIGNNYYTVGVVQSVKIEEQAVKLRLFMLHLIQRFQMRKMKRIYFVTAKYSF